MLADKGVVEAIADAFASSADQELAERLLRGIEAGRDAGGQVGGQGHLPERSAALLVHGVEDHAQLDLRVDMHPEAVGALRELFTSYAPYVAYRKQRWRNPETALPQERFVASLSRQPAITRHAASASSAKCSRRRSSGSIMPSSTSTSQLISRRQ